MSDERRLAVLRAIVQDYVATQEPVGSKALVERHGLGVSPATVRNDMAALEEEGLIHAPHTSAGRIPTDKGYRLFVDRLTQVKPMSVAEQRAISRFLQEAQDLDDVVQRSVRLLAQLTQQVAIVQYPTLARSTVRHVELVAMTSQRVLAVVILSTGRVEQRLIDLPNPLGDEDLSALREKLNRAAAGQRIAEAVTALAELTSPGVGSQTMAVLATSLIEAMSNHRSDERVVVGGTSHLAGFGESFDLSIRPMLEALEEHVVLLKLLGEAEANGLRVTIGNEGPFEQLAGTSVVSSGYGPQEQSIAAMGVVGPTRMDYPHSMAAVGAVARYVSSILEDS